MNESLGLMKKPSAEMPKRRESFPLLHKELIINKPPLISPNKNIINSIYIAKNNKYKNKPAVETQTITNTSRKVKFRDEKDLIEVESYKNFNLLYSYNGVNNKSNSSPCCFIF